MTRTVNALRQTSSAPSSGGHAGLLSTTLDLRETIRQGARGEDANRAARADGGRRGTSLLTPLLEERRSCARTEDVPDKICALLDGSMDGLEKDVALAALDPASVLSFYADIPLRRRDHLNISDTAPLTRRD